MVHEREVWLMKQIVFVLVAVILLTIVFVLAFREKTVQMWGVFVFLALLGVGIYLLVFQGFSRATLKAFGAEGAVEKRRESEESDATHATMQRFDETEQRVLRYLHMAFLETAESPEWVRIPIERIMTDNNLNPNEGSNVIRRFDALGILQKVGADPESLRFRYIKPLVLEFVACLE